MFVKEVTATDADTGINAELVYRIQKGAFDDFAINETTGIVTVFRKLDYDNKNRYHVEIIALDKGRNTNNYPPFSLLFSQKDSYYNRFAK